MLYSYLIQNILILLEIQHSMLHVDQWARTVHTSRQIIIILGQETETAHADTNQLTSYIFETGNNIIILREKYFIIFSYIMTKHT